MQIDTIINEHLSNKTAVLLEEMIEGRMDISKEIHLKKYIELDASFIHIVIVPINADTINQPMYVRYYKIDNKEEHNFCNKYFKDFLQGTNHD